MQNTGFVENTIYEIKTSTGWSDFRGMASQSVEEYLKISFSNGTSIDCSKKHPFFINGVEVLAGSLVPNDMLDGMDKWKITSIDHINQPTNLFDIIETDNHDYIIEQSLYTHNCDELAFVNQSIQQEFWKSMQPTLSTGGACIISSTPNGEGDLFSELWHGAEMGANGYAPIYVRWDEPPGRDENFKKETVAQLGELSWRQEFECEFLTSEMLLIDSIFLQNLKHKISKIRPIKEADGITWFEDISPNATYILGIDPASGSGRDFSVIQLFEFPTLTQVAQFRSNKVSSPQLYNSAKKIMKIIDEKNSKSYFSVENNGVGEGLIALYQNDESVPESSQFVSEEGKNRLGMVTTQRSKMKACLNLKSLLQSNKLTIKSLLLHTELTKYAVGKGSYEALPGATDDCVAATLIVVRILNEISSYEQEAFDALYSYEEDAQEYNVNGESMEEPLAMLI